MHTSISTHLRLSVHIPMHFAFLLPLRIPTDSMLIINWYHRVCVRACARYIRRLPWCVCLDLARISSSSSSCFLLTGWSKTVEVFLVRSLISKRNSVGTCISRVLSKYDIFVRVKGVPYILMSLRNCIMLLFGCMLSTKNVMGVVT